MRTEFIENATEISFVRDRVVMYGCTSLPTYNRAVSDEQYLFINNRTIKDNILNIALKVAYKDYLARDKNPVSIIFLSVNPEQVGLNAQPTKSEVLFNDPNMIRGMVISSIKDALNNSRNRVSTTPSAAVINYMRSTEHHSGFYKNSTNQGRFGIPSSEQNRSSPTVRAGYTMVQAPQVIQRLAESAPQSIVEQDSHNAAHERIDYEKIKRQIDKNGLIKQRLLIPEIVELSDESKAKILDENKVTLAKPGLTIEKFGKNQL
jgi:DNA mismatch repair protein MutL